MEGLLEISFIAEGYPSLNILNEMKNITNFTDYLVLKGNTRNAHQMPKKKLSKKKTSNLSP